MIIKQVFMQKIIITLPLILLMFTGCITIDMGEKEGPAEEITPLAVTVSSEALSNNHDATSEGAIMTETESYSMGQAETGSNDMTAGSGNNMMMSPSNGEADPNSMTMAGSNDPMAEIPSMPQLERPTITNFPEEDIDSDEVRQAIELLVTDLDMALLLQQTGEWHLDGWYDQDEGMVGIDFFDADWEWIAWGSVTLTEDGDFEIEEAYAPRELTPAEYQAGLAAVEALVLKNGEVLTLLGDPDAWERYTDYDRWEGTWYVSFEKGLDSVAVIVGYWEEAFYVDDIYDPDVLSEEELVHQRQDRAIEIAYGAEGIDAAVYEVADNWKTIVTELGPSSYGVSFVSAGEELFFAEVDIESGEVVSTVQ